MTTQLYLVPLPEAQTTQPPTQAARSNIASAGLIGQQSGLATERIALGGVDLSVRGQYRAGEFSKKLKRELESLGESGYEGVPFADEANPAADDQSGYYELGNVDVNPAHQSTDLAYQYTVTLDYTGTRASHWRAVTTNSESIGTSLATGSGGLVGIPTEASQARWFDQADGTESASVDSTVNAEYGDVDLFDPTEPTFDDPTLIYALAFDREGPVDVRVWDDVGESDKFASYDDADGTTYDITQWVHGYHADFEFEGKPIVDNGLLRVAFDEDAGTIPSEAWTEGTSSWDAVSITYGDYELYNADIQSVSPSSTEVFTEWEDTTDGSIDAAVLSFQRGIAGAVVRQPPSGTVPTALANVLDPIASEQTTDKQPSQEVVPRGDVR